jgi:hypothetical protein
MNQSNNNIFFQYDFKATDRKRAYHLAEDKLWNILMDDKYATPEMVERIIDEAEFCCVDCYKETR